MSAAARKIVYCHCAYARVVPPEVKAEVLKGLASSGREFEAVPDLCELSARRDPALKELAGDTEVTIVACYPRAIKWLFSAAGAALPAEGIEILNMREQPADTILHAISGAGG